MQKHGNAEAARCRPCDAAVASARSCKSGQVSSNGGHCSVVAVVIIGSTVVDGADVVIETEPPSEIQNDPKYANSFCTGA
jgi:hypothetical protein